MAQKSGRGFGLGDVMMCEENATLHKRTKWAQSVSTWAVTLVPLVTSIFYWLFVACCQGSGGNQCSQCNRCKRFKRCKRCKQSNRCQPCRAGTDSAGNANENLEEQTNICKYVEYFPNMCMTCRRLQMLWCVTITLLWSYSLKHPQAKGGGWLKPTLIQDLNLLEACDARQTGWNPRNRWWIMEDHGSIKGFPSTYRPNFLRTPKCVGCIWKQLAWVGIHAWLILI